MKKFQLEMGGKNPLVVLDDADLKIAVEVRRQRRLLLDRPALHRLLAPDRHRRHPRPLRRGADRAAEGPRRSTTRSRPARISARWSTRASSTRTCATSRSARTRAPSSPSAASCSSARRPGFYLAAGAVHRGQQQDAHHARGDLRPGRQPSSASRTTTRRWRSPTTREFGLSSGICTTSLKYATHFKRNSEAGMVMVNLPTAGVDYHVPFGGRKGSSYGAARAGLATRASSTPR